MRPSRSLATRDSRHGHQSQLLALIVRRLTKASNASLPLLASQQAERLRECSDLFFPTIEDGQPQKPGSNSHVPVHQFKVYLTTLLQAGGPQSNFAGVVILKAYIEIGGRQALLDAGHWTRSLVSLFQRPFAYHLKRLCILVLLRTYLLAHGDAALVREVATPTLPSFISSCLALVEGKGKKVGLSSTRQRYTAVVLKSFEKLLPLHATIFRPFLVQIRTLTVRHIASVPSSDLSFRDASLSSPNLAPLARRVFVAAHLCAPRNTSAQTWQQSLGDIIAASHLTLDQVFRCFNEERLSRLEERIASRAQPIQNAPQCEANVSIGLPGWTGMFAGIERIDGLLQTITSFISAAFRSTVIMPVFSVVDLAERIMAPIVLLRGHRDSFKSNISHEEREALVSSLPLIYARTVRLLSAMVLRFGTSFGPVSLQVWNMVVPLFSMERMTRNSQLLYSSCALLCHLIKSIGTALPKTYSEGLGVVAQVCCRFLHSSKFRDVGLNLYSTNSEESQLNRILSDTLASILVHLPADCLPMQTRSTIDRIAIVTQNKDLIVASVMNPPTSEGSATISSILPMLARHFPQSSQFEAFVRPQMPVLQYGKSDADFGNMLAADVLPEDSLEQMKDYSPRPDTLIPLEDRGTKEQVAESAGEARGPPDSQEYGADTEMQMASSRPDEEPPRDVPVVVAGEIIGQMQPEAELNDLAEQVPLTNHGIPPRTLIAGQSRDEEDSDDSEIPPFEPGALISDPSDDDEETVA